LLVATEELKKPSSGSRKKKNMANEQIRNAEIKTKIKELEKNLERYLPTKKNVPRIRTLRLSKAYIEHMVNVLNGSRVSNCYYK
jgi:hypothetical protein